MESRLWADPYLEIYPKGDQHASISITPAIMGNSHQKRMKGLPCKKWFDDECKDARKKLKFLLKGNTM